MRIECPDCSQRFDVTEDFMDKTVECGSCDGRFKVDNDVLVKEKEKFYPGEKRNMFLERFASSGASSVASSPAATQVGFAQAHYQPNVDVTQIGPPRPRRTMSAILGVSLMVVVIVIFLLAGGKEGPMRDMETSNRFVLVGFTAALGCLLILYGTVQNRLKGIALSLLFGGGLLVLPVLFPGNPTSASEEFTPDFANSALQKKSTTDSQEEIMKDYLNEIGYRPVAEALEKHPSDAVAAVFVRNARKIVRDKISDYLYEEMGKVSRGTSYDQIDEDQRGMILMLNQKITLTEIATMCGKFGRINKIHRDLRVIDVTVENSKIIKLDPTQSLDSQSPDYYRQQLSALRSFDPEVKMKAVKRLAGVEPKSLRDDISKALIEMLPMSQNDLKLEVINTLRVWSKDGDGAELPALQAVQQLHKDGQVNKSAITFLIDRQVDGTQIVLMELWNNDPVAWSDLFVKLGEGAQVLLLPQLKDMDPVHLVAAADILGKSGSKACIPHLKEVMETQETSGKKSLQAAIDEIEKRP